MLKGLFIWEARRDIFRDGTFDGDGTFAGTGRLPRRDVCQNGTLKGISPCMYIYPICRIPFIWKDFFRDVFRPVLAKRDPGSLNRDPQQLVTDQSTTENVSSFKVSPVLASDKSSPPR